MATVTAVDPCDFVIFGGTGDLAGRKLLPALYLRDRARISSLASAARELGA
jgi:glucose-6-phosphate 1-dehydrogenase